jgi:hypothetical protein
MHEFNTRRDFITELKPLIKLKQFQSYSNIGLTQLSHSQLIQMIKLYGRKAFNTDVVNVLYVYAASYRHRDIKAGL